MNDALSKIESFFFDILGLVLPGLIFLALLILPIWLVDLGKFSPKDIDSSFILSELSTISKLIKAYWVSNSPLVITIIFITSYLAGHFVKVFAIIKYEILTAIFDKSLNPTAIFLFDKLEVFLSWIYCKFSYGSFSSTRFYKWLRSVFAPIKNTLNKVFIFKPLDYLLENDSLKTDCVNIINSRLSVQYPDKWHSVYKFSAVITNQENIKSLAGHFLAKYNLYRSLAFIFLFIIVYYYIFFSAANKYISPDLGKITSLVLVVCSLLWFTFHSKYKRYWTLCGNETLVSLFYFLNKKKINEI